MFAYFKNGNGCQFLYAIVLQFCRAIALTSAGVTNGFGKELDCEYIRVLTVIMVNYDSHLLSVHNS